MRCHPLFLREVHRALPMSSAYLTVRACVASLVFVVLAMSCGPAPKGQYHVPETAIAAAAKTTPEQSMQTAGNLPEAAAINLREMPYVRNIFKQPLRIDRGGLDDFYATTRGKVQHIAIISNTSLDVLKAFIAKGWAPIVVVQLQGRSPEILPLSAYNDRSSEVFLQNPVNLGERRVSYKDFGMYGTASSRNKCVLITPQLAHGCERSRSIGEIFTDRSVPASSCQKSLIPSCDMRHDLFFPLIMENSDGRKRCSADS